jgi:hypothetical protein
VHRPPLSFEFIHQGKNAPAWPIDAFISGHIHLFGAYTFSGEAPQVIVGIGGDNLDPPLAIQKLLDGVAEDRFGYALFVHAGKGWNIEVHDTTMALHRSCRLEARKLTCGPPLTGAP